MSAEKLAAQARLDELRLQLIEIEKAKKQEASVRKEIESLAAEIANRQSESQFFKKENNDDEEDTDAPAKSPAVKPGKSPAMSATKSPAIKAAEAPEDATKKRIKALNKKLQQITALKEKSRDDLDSEQKAKLDSEEKILKEIDALKKGEVFEDDSDGEAKRADLPTDPAEREKRVKALKKKLDQITKLKESKATLDADGQAKVASERKIVQEIEALEAGHKEVMYQAQDPQEAFAEEKTALEKQLKALNKKLAQIAKLKEAGGDLDAAQKEKIASQKAVQKEAHVLTEAIANLNKQERARVEERLGWEADEKMGKNKGKK